MLVLTRPDIILGHSRGVPRGGRRHHRDELVQQHHDRASRLRDGAVCPRVEHRGRKAGAPGHRQMDDARQAPLCRRRARADQQDALDLARCQRPGIPRGHLRSDERRVRRANTRAHRRRGGRPAHRDDHRHAQRESCPACRRRNRSRRSGADHSVGDDHRSQRPHAVGTDDRRVLGLGDARPAARRGYQLRARRARDEAVSRGAVACGDNLRQQLPERRAAERVRPVRPARARNRRAREGFRRQRVREHRRRLLRHDARSHSRDRRTSGRRPRRKIPTADGRPSFKSAHTQFAGLEVLSDPTRQQLPDDRRAHERDRLEEVSAADQGRQVRRGGGRRARAGARRREPHRRQHGRGPARLGAGDDALPEPDCDRAGDFAAADHDRQLEVVGARGRVEVRAGETRRQFDQPEGRRRRLPEESAPDPAIRRGRRRDGVRRDRSGRHDRAQGGDLPSRLQAADRDGSTSIRPTSSSIRTSWRLRPGSKSTTSTPSTSSRRAGRSRPRAPV